MLLDPAGTVIRRIALPEAVFPNGGLLLATDRLLLADSARARLAGDLPSGTATVWLDHPLLRPNLALPHRGVNGIKRNGDGLMLSTRRRGGCCGSGWMAARPCR